MLRKAARAKSVAVKDAAAKTAIAAVYGTPVVQLDLDNLYGNGGGGTHCVTMQEPAR
ncbi:hypothetical protein ACWFR1_21275 [Streptomyces sp. NPDC055103]